MISQLLNQSTNRIQGDHSELINTHKIFERFNKTRNLKRPSWALRLWICNVNIKHGCLSGSGLAGLLPSNIQNII